MKDMVPKGTGNSRFLRSSIPENITYEEFVALLRSGKFPVDFAGLNLEGIATQGSAYNKANVLPDGVCKMLGIPTSSEPKDAFQSLQKKQWRELERITSSKTWVVPEGITQIGAFLLGGGQSGQGYGLRISTSDSYGNGSAKGGASGWGKSVILNVTPGQQIKAVIGSGGVCTNGARATGGNTLFGPYSAMGGGRTRSKAAGVQDVLYFDYDAAAFVKDVNSPFGGVSGLAGITFDDYDYGVVSWISTAVEEEKNIFLPTMKAFGLGECIALQYCDDSTIRNQYKTSAVDLGTMGKAGVAKVYTFRGDGKGSTYKGGDASGYGNGGGACMSCTTDRLNYSTTLGGNGSPGIIIIYV